VTDSTDLPLPPESKLFCFGFGYCAEVLARQLNSLPVQISGTRRRAVAIAERGPRLAMFDGAARAPAVADLLSGTTHLLLSIPPDADGDPALRWHRDDLAQLTSLTWIGYLSTVGVYGDTGGAWIDEAAPVSP
jgi:hypothetical protein